LSLIPPEPSTLLLFGSLGWTEIIILLVLVLLIFGTRLPNLMRNLGKGVTSFKQGLKEGSESDDRDAKERGA